MELTITGRHGTLTTYQITGADEPILSAIQEITTYPATLDGDVITGRGSKSDVRSIQDAVNARAHNQTGTADRYIERLSVAQQRGLKHGKSWVATGYHVDRDSIDPSWEGQLICYVYPQ